MNPWSRILDIRALLILPAVVGLLLLTGCAGVPAVGSPSNALVAHNRAADAIHWPEKYEPEDATFFVHNEILIQAPPEVVWEIVIQAETWPAWYEGASNVKVQGSIDGKLASGSAFDWRTMDQDFTSRVMEYSPPFRLSWESRKSTIQGYHAWLVIPIAGGCRVVTDESQHGFLATMQGVFLPDKLRLLHDVWLSQIKKKAEARVATPGTTDSRPSRSPAVSTSERGALP